MDPSSQEMVALLEQALAQAKTGELMEVFLWCRTRDSESDYEFLAHDVDDMLFELGTAILTERIAQPVPERVPRRS